MLNVLFPQIFICKNSYWKDSWKDMDNSLKSKYITWTYNKTSLLLELYMSYKGMFIFMFEAQVTWLFLWLQQTS